MVVQQNDGVFPNVTNSTGTVSVAIPSGTSFIKVNLPREANQVVADQTKRHDEAGNPIDNDEILPGFSKEKRQHNTCHLVCTPFSLADICQGSPVFANCDADCELHVATPTGGNGVGPLDSNPDVYEDQITCLNHCSCTGGHGEQVVDDGINKDDPFQGLD